MFLKSAKAGQTTQSLMGKSLGSIIARNSFSPADISDLYAWYDFSDLSTITKDVSDRVSNVDNKEGTVDRDLVQATGSSQPLWLSAALNGLDVIDTVGDRELSTATALTALTQPVTIFLVIKYPTTALLNHQFDCHGSVATSITALQDGTNANVIYLNSGTSLTPTITGLNSDSYHLMTYLANTTASVIRSDMVEAGTGNTGTNTFQPLTLGRIRSSQTGKTRFWNNQFAEMIIYDKLLDSTEIGLVETYLKDKWGTP